MNEYYLLWSLNVLLQVTCVSALGLAIAALIRRHAAAKYWVLSAALLLMLLSPLSVAVMQSLGHSLVSIDAQASTANNEGGPVGSIATAPVRSKAEESATWQATPDMMERVAAVDAAVPISSEDTELSSPPIVAPPTIGEDVADTPQRHTSENAATAITAIEPRSVPARAPQESAPRGVWRLIVGTLFGVWLAGAAFQLARLGVSLWQLHRMLHRAAPNVNPVIAEILAGVCRQLTLKRIPELLMSAEVSGPVSAGVVRPRIVLPTRLAESDSTAVFYNILVHEAAHVLRRDQLTALLQNIVGAIFWFHPLTAWLNRVLAQAREEVCDNYVLATASGPSYSRTLLTVAELITPRPVPGAVGLFSSRWRLENRVAGLLDEHRSRVVELKGRAKLLIAGLSLVMATVAALGTVTLATGQDSTESAPEERAEAGKADEASDADSNKNPLLDGPTLRGEGEDRSMLLRGRVLDPNGKPAQGFEVVAICNKGRIGRDVLPVKADGSRFEIWVPVGGSKWSYLEVAATANDGRSRAFEGIARREFRQAAIEGIDLRLTPTQRVVEVTVKHAGAPVANAHVNAQLSGNLLLQGKTDVNGHTTFRLGAGDKLRQFTAWTDDFRIGGFSFGRKPRRDPLGSEFTIDLDDCRDQTIRLLDADERKPVAGISFELIVGTGQPNYNFAAVPATFPHCRMTTNEQGEATFRWFPDWKTHGAYLEIIDPRWAKAVRNDEIETGDDGALVMTLKRRVSRKPFVGKVTSDRFDVGGLLVEIKSFQGEEEGHSDHIYVFTDEEGNFTANCIPGATYTVCVNDGQLQSNMIDLIPYELDTGKSNVAKLKVSEGNPIEIRVTSGASREPMTNQWVYVRQVHRFTWIEDGEKRNGSGARDYPVYTDDHGIARARAPAGSELRITIYAGEWRSDDRTVKVKEDGLTIVEFHRKIDKEREVNGRLRAPTSLDADLAGAEIVFGSIGGETDERQVTSADAEGRFAFKTKAIQLGIFAYTVDGKAAGMVKPERLDRPIEVPLKPTMDLHGQLLGKNKEPLAGHAVRVKPRVKGKRDFNKSFATSFETKVFETKTDANGNYTLKNLPTEFDMTLRADPIDDSKYDAYLDDVYLVVGEERPRMVSRLGRTRQPEDRSLAKRHADTLRSAKLDSYHVLVLIYDSQMKDDINSRLLDRDVNREVMSFLNLRIDQDSLANDADRKFAESKNWPPPTPNQVFACALDADGKELGRIELDVNNAESAVKAADFIRKYALPQADARAKWDAAFAEAKRSGRRVWARIGQRYCGPCFRFSRWLDDNHEVLNRDYVLLKIDNVRDKHGDEVAKRIVGDRENFGVPFHAIFAADGRLLVDSESPVGNIGHPSSFEGRRHLAKMLHGTRKKLMKSDVDQIVRSLLD